jgi:hypothetical protein
MFLDFVHRLMFLKTHRFGNWICFHPQVKIMGPLVTGPVIEQVVPLFYLGTERDPVSEMMCF